MNQKVMNYGHIKGLISFAKELGSSRIPVQRNHEGAGQQQKEGMTPPLHERAIPCKEIHRNPPVNLIHRSRQ